MDSHIAIQVNHLSKEFKVFFDKGSSLKEKVLFKKRRRYETRSVLKDISFEVKRGEAIGIVGENGCGKSTLLKMLSRIMYPDAGDITIDGRVSALIELGAGFHPDMSGRENIYINAAIFGLTKKEIDERLRDIINFSELHDYIDNPVRTYSSGMYMRLAFSVAINVDADILLIDEILAVGDAAFQAKCFNKLREIKANGTTIVIVSHSLGQIEQICDRSIWIHDGIIRQEGVPREVHPEYMDYMGRKNVVRAEEQQPLPEGNVQVESSDTAEGSESENRWGDGSARVTSVRILDEAGKEQTVLPTGGGFRIAMDYIVNCDLENPVCGIGIFRNDGVQCYGTNTQIDHIAGISLGKSGAISVYVEKNLLLPGEYSLDVAIHAEDGFAYDYYRDAKRFRVYSNIQDVGVMRLEHVWKIDCANGT